MKRILQTEREFENLTVPLSPDEEERLEHDLIRNGCVEPVVIWNDVIIDGHKRYKICSYEEIEYETREMTFASRDSAIIWVCRERLPQASKCTAIWRYLVGKWYISKKRENRELRRKCGRREGNEQYVRSEHNSIWDTSRRLAEEIGASRDTVEQCGAYADAMDKIAVVDPVLFRAILAKELQFTYREIFQMAEQDKKTLNGIRRKHNINRKEKSRSKAKKHKNGMDATQMETQLMVGIKNMPEYDPDMELKGLALTIPTWMNVISRTERNTDMEKTSDEAKVQLLEIMDRLDEQVRQMMEALK